MVDWMSGLPRPLLAVAGVLLLAMSLGCYFSRGLVDLPLLRMTFTVIGYAALAGGALTVALAVWPRREEDDEVAP